MPVKVKLECSGCFATAEGTHNLRGRFVSLCGQSYGIGGLDSHHLLDSLMSAAPEGWIMFDPYTFATYCPTCWASIISE